MKIGVPCDVRVVDYSGRIGVCGIVFAGNNSKVHCGWEVNQSMVGVLQVEACMK